MGRNDDQVILTREHLALRERLKAGPAFGFELAHEFGEDYANLLKDLKDSDCPIHSAPALSDGHSGDRVYYHEKPGSELSNCMWCKTRTRTSGPFCSHDCQLDWEVDRLDEMDDSYEEYDGEASLEEGAQDRGLEHPAHSMRTEPDEAKPWKAMRRERERSQETRPVEKRPVSLARRLVSIFARRKDKVRTSALGRPTAQSVAPAQAVVSRRDDAKSVEMRVQEGLKEGTSKIHDLLSSRHMRFDEDRMNMPASPGIYLVYENSEPIYIGSSNNLRRRVFSQLFRNRSHYFAYYMVYERFHTTEAFQKHLVSQCTVQWLATEDEDEAHWVERFAIGTIRPIYNGGTKSFKR